jgi:hypothetical protein
MIPNMNLGGEMGDRSPNRAGSPLMRRPLPQRPSGGNNPGPISPLEETTNQQVMADVLPALGYVTVALGCSTGGC